VKAGWRVKTSLNRAGQDGVAQRAEGDDVGGRRLLEQCRDLEDVAGTEPDALLAMYPHRRLAGKDESAPRSLPAAAEYHFVLDRRPRLDLTDDGLDVRAGQVGEQGEPSQLVGRGCFKHA